MLAVAEYWGDLHIVWLVWALPPVQLPQQSTPRRPEATGFTPTPYVVDGAESLGLVGEVLAETQHLVARHLAASPGPAQGSTLCPSQVATAA